MGSIIQKIAIISGCILVFVLTVIVEELRIKSLDVQKEKALSQVTILQNDINQQNAYINQLKKISDDINKKNIQLANKAKKQITFYDGKSSEIARHYVSSDCLKAIKYGADSGPSLYQNWISQ